MKEVSTNNDTIRCLNCNKICEVCAEVCPNRANVRIILSDGSHQIVHIDSMCNECGNCKVFCPYESAPYKNKLTLFYDKKAMDDSINDGFYFENDNIACIRLNNEIFKYELNATNEKLGKIAEIINIISNKKKHMSF